MQERELLKSEMAARGPTAIDYFEQKAQECRSKGDAGGEARWRTKIQLAIEIVAEQISEGKRLSGLRPNDVALFGAIADTEFQEDFDFGHGITLKRTYAHVFASFTISFEPPKIGEFSPGPWKSAGAGIGFDVVAELSIPVDSKPTEFDRLNTIWWLISLMRLHHAHGLRLPVVSDLSFSEIRLAPQEPKFWPIELSTNLQTFQGFQRRSVITSDTLKWIRDHFKQGATLMEMEQFNLAYNALAASHFASTIGTANILIWTSLEALFRPGRTYVAKTLSSMIATYLNDIISERDHKFDQIRSLYEVRGGSVHAAKEPTAEDTRQVFELARSCYIKAIESRSIPDGNSLITRWQQRK